MDQQRGRPVLIEFWDFCRPNSIRTLPYLKAWHQRYSPLGLRVIGVHSSGFEPSEDPAAVAQAVARLGIDYPVVVDVDHQIWLEYENLGWPARYLFTGDHRLFEYHFGEGGYAETETAIQELLGIERETLAPMRPEEHPEAMLAAQTDDVAGPYSGPYEAGGVWGVFEGEGVAIVNGRRIEIAATGAYELISHERHTEAVLELETSGGLQVLAVCFTPGLAEPGAEPGLAEPG
jgi:hypothetical protein